MGRLEKNFLALVLLFTFSILMVGFFAFKQVTDDVIEAWGQRMAENQVKYNSSRLLQPLEREIALARQMARSPSLIEWASNPKDEKLKATAMRELESFRQSFLAKNYFIALTKTNGYFHNNEENSFLGSELRYYLRPDRPADAWFFRLVEDERDFHININPDVELGVTKLWIDILMRDSEGEILAVLGTGLPLEEVISDIIASESHGVFGMFVDVHGAIQLYQDRRLIDFASFVQPEGQKRTIDLVVDYPQEGEMLLQTMKQVQNSPEIFNTILTRYVTISGQRHLVGISYLPTVGWFDVTFLNLAEIMPKDKFLPLAGVILLVLLLSIFFTHYVLRKQILLPLSALSAEMSGFAKSGRKPDILERIYPGELGQVFNEFKNMVSSIEKNTEKLEEMVASRTKELELKAQEDSLTGLLNRGAMTSILQREAERCTRDARNYGIIWIDFDNFKKLNDSSGHAAGDLALKELGNILRKELRSYDYSARWGGDEFLVFLSPCDPERLTIVRERILHAVSENDIFKELRVSVSTGAALSSAGESPEDVLERSDADLYQKKRIKVI